MLTSTLVQTPPFDLPESDSKTIANTDLMVAIDEKGIYKLNGTPIRKGDLEGKLRELVDEDHRENLYLTVVSEINNKFDETLEVMKIANRLKLKAILATTPKS